MLAVTTAGGTTATGSATATLPPGTYTISEAPPACWTLKNISCLKTSGAGSASGATVVLADGAEATCTVTNAKETAGLTFKKTARAASYSRLSEPADFDIEITNGLGSAMTHVVIADPTAALSGCTASTLASGATLRCTATHAVTQQDLDTGRYTNTATVSATANGQPVTAVGVATMTARTAPRLAMTATAQPQTYTAPGETITYAFVARNTGTVALGAFAFSVEGAVLGACAPVTIGGQLAAGASTTCTARHIATTGEMAQPCLTAAGQATGTPPGASAVTVTATAKTCRTGAQTAAAISHFITRRIDLLTSNEPDNARLLRRLNGSGSAAAGDSAGPVAMTGSGDGGNSRLALATSLERIRSHAHRAPGAGGDDQHMGLGAIDKGNAAQPSALDIWLEAHYQRWNDGSALSSISDSHSGDFGVAYLSADYLVMPGVLIGALVQLDWMSDIAKADNTQVNGAGWMAGPYLSMKLGEHLLFDARGAWGTSTNHISPFATYSETFDTERWLTKANLTGNWMLGAVRVSPSVGIIYAGEEQSAYIDKAGVAIDGRPAHIGRLTFGPEFGTIVDLDGGSTLEPHIAFTGMWDFSKSGTRDVSGAVITGDDLRMKIEGGATLRGETGASVRAAVSYDGIGASDFSAWGGQLSLNIPIETLGEGAPFGHLLGKCCDGRSSLGGEPEIQIAQAADAPKSAGTPPAASGSEPAPAGGDEPAFELPAVVVKTAKEPPPPAAAPKRKKASPVMDEPAPAPQKAKPSKAKKSSPSEDAGAPQTTQADGPAKTSGSGGGGGTGGAATSGSQGSTAVDLSGRTTGALFYDADGNTVGGVAAVQFATLFNHPLTVGQADFVII